MGREGMSRRAVKSWVRGQMMRKKERVKMRRKENRVKMRRK